jgi:hypothetical protein
LDDLGDRLEPGRPGDERPDRVEQADLVIEAGPLPGAQVGRVGDDRVELPRQRRRQRGVPVALEQPDGRGRSPDPGAVGGGDDERVTAAVGREHRNRRRLGRDGEGERAGARAEIDDRRRGGGGPTSGEIAQQEIDQELGLGPRHEHPAVDEELEVAEGRALEHML